MASEEESQLPRWSRGRLSGAGRHSRLLTAAGLGIFVLFALLPVWVVEYFPSQDGPNHLFIAEVWSHYDEPDRRDVIPPIEVESATWSPGGTLDWWVKERQEWLGRVRGTNGRQKWVRATDLRRPPPS